VPIDSFTKPLATPAENLGFGRYELLLLDRRAHGPRGEPDGVHTLDELRKTLQQDSADFQRAPNDPFTKSRLDTSKRVFRAMLDNKVTAVDYLPENLRDIDAALRPRAAELLGVAHEISNGTIDQLVIDNLRQRYEEKLTKGSIAQPTRDVVIRQIELVVEHLQSKGEVLV
jgi:hypothetical protein